jgi:hypothetical protein
MKDFEADLVVLSNNGHVTEVIFFCWEVVACSSKT